MREIVARGSASRIVGRAAQTSGGETAIPRRRKSPKRGYSNRVVAAVGRDLAKGTWDAKYGHLREFDEFDAGLRLVASVA